LEGVKLEFSGIILDRINRIDGIAKLITSNNIEGEIMTEEFNGTVALIIDYRLQ
jgi:hypothetical protein